MGDAERPDERGAPADAGEGSHPAVPGSRSGGIAPPRFRAPAGTRLGRVRFQVADLERSSAFYRDVLGFRVLAQDGAMVALGAQPRRRNAPPPREAEDAPDPPLIELVERRGASPVPPRGRLGLFHAAVLLPDRASLGRALTHLVRANTALGSADHLVSEALYLNDPDGLGLEIYADRPRDSWRTVDRPSGRELAMGTEPLDAPRLMAAGGDRAWEGVPPGTTIGHVHLSVGDLATAEAFFHDGLGLDEVVWSYPGALFFSAGGYHHHVGANTWARGAAPAGDGDARLLEWRLVMPHPDAASDVLRSLADEGFADRVDRRGSRAVDPWGTRVRVSTDA